MPLGTGSADFDEVFKQLKKINYSGNFILQTARATNDSHAQVLNDYKLMTEKWIRNVFE